jgi:multiple sugar transport system substrate-binding protein
MRNLPPSLAALLVAAGLAGPALADPVTITYTTFSAAPNYISQLEATIAAFEAAHPDIKVNYENFVSYASKGALADLGPQIAADTEFSTAIYNPTALAAFQQDGKQYGLVESFSNVVLFYNKDLFDKAGVAYPTAEWTWKDELAAAQKLTDSANGVWGDFAPIQFWEFYKTIAQNGG